MVDPSNKENQPLYEEPDYDNLHDDSDEEIRFRDDDEDECKWFGIECLMDFVDEQNGRHFTNHPFACKSISCFTEVCSVCSYGTLNQMYTEQQDVNIFL